MSTKETPVMGSQKKEIHHEKNTTGIGQLDYLNLNI